MSIKSYPIISDWLCLTNGKLQLRTGKVDIGQRISTALVGIVHQEMTLSDSLISVQPVSTLNSPDEGMTSGSNSIEQSGHALRLACATLRNSAIAYICAQLGGQPKDWILENGEFTRPETNMPILLINILAKLDFDLPIDPYAEIRTIEAAHGLSMRGLPELVEGRYQFLHDLSLPEMVHARIVRPPNAKASLRGFRKEIATRLEAECIHILHDGSFLAVSGSCEWSVVRAAQRLFQACEWDLGEGLEESPVQECLNQENAIRFLVKDGRPLEGQAIPENLSAPTHQARYERPFTMHASLAPSSACALWDGEKLWITTHSQGIYTLRESIAESLGLSLDHVILEFMPGSGCYGHNGADDAAFEAALVAMSRRNTPVLLKWNREDEHAWEPYGPASATELAAVVTPEGQITAFSAEAIGGTFRGRPRSGADLAGPAKLLANHFRSTKIGPHDGSPNMNRHGGLHRNLVPIYDFGETRFVKNLVTTMPHRTSALRCLGAALNIFAIESFIDEIAAGQGLDSFELRRAHLHDPRAILVLNRLEQELRTRVLVSGSGRGIAYAQYKNEMTRVAAAVDLTISDAAQIQIQSILLVADAGRIVDSDGLQAQLEGGALQAISWALFEKVTWDKDGVISRDWNSYPILRFPDVPKIETILLNHPTGKSLGAGEASPGPVLAAIANAVADLTGLRARSLPMTPDSLRTLALS